MRGLRAIPIWLVMGGTALLASVLTVGVDRGIARLLTTPTPVPATAPPRQIVVTLPTDIATPQPSKLSADQTALQLQQHQQQIAQLQATIQVYRADAQLSLALEALAANDMSRANNELVAAKVSLDEAFAVGSEAIKPQIDTERMEIGRLRADLSVNPRGIDGDIRRMRDRLLSLVTAQ